MTTPAPLSLTRLAKFVRTVAQVPKKELDAKLAEYERRKRARVRRKKTA